MKVMGCPTRLSLKSYFFILSTELLAQKISQCRESNGIKLPNNVEVRLSQFADDTTLICKKTKAIWIGSQKKNKTKPLAIDITHEPTKTRTIVMNKNNVRITTKTFSSKFGNNTKCLAVSEPHPNGTSCIGKSIREF